MLDAAFDAIASCDVSVHVGYQGEPQWVVLARESTHDRPVFSPGADLLSRIEAELEKEAGRV